MPLPFSPVPPARAAIRSTRLPVTMVPSSPAVHRHTWMPALPQSVTVLSVIANPVDFDRADARASRFGHRRAGDAPGRAVDRQPIAGAVGDDAALDGDTAALRQMHEPRDILGVGLAGAVDGQAGERDDLAMRPGDHAVAAGEHQRWSHRSRPKGGRAAAASGWTPCRCRRAGRSGGLLPRRCRATSATSCSGPRPSPR